MFCGLEGSSGMGFLSSLRNEVLVGFLGEGAEVLGAREVRAEVDIV